MPKAFILSAITPYRFNGAALSLDKLQRGDMRNVLWLVKLLLYKHQEKRAHYTQDNESVLYDVGYANQIHANLCVEACESMMRHFYNLPFSTLIDNPRGILHGQSEENAAYRALRDANTIDKVRDVLSEYGPFITGIQLRMGWHAICVIGVSGESLIYHDPLSGCNKMLNLEEMLRLNDNRLEVQVPTYIESDAQHKILLDKIIDTLDLINHDIMPPVAYQKAFSLKASSNPCKAVLKMLAEYSQPSLLQNIFGVVDKNPHRKQIREYVEKQQNNTHLNLNTLLTELNEMFVPKDRIEDHKVVEIIDAINKVMQPSSSASRNQKRAIESNKFLSKPEGNSAGRQ